MENSPSNNIAVVQNLACHVERSEPLGRRPVGERQTSRKVRANERKYKPVYDFSASAAELNGIATICLLEKLLGGDKPPFVATDAFIPRRRSR